MALVIVNHAQWICLFFEEWKIVSNFVEYKIDCQFLVKLNKNVQYIYIYCVKCDEDM